jgi:hypothetical protein
MMLAVWGFLETIGGVYEGLRSPQEQPQVTFIVSNPKGSLRTRATRGNAQALVCQELSSNYTPLRLLHSHLHNHDRRARTG